MLKQNYSAIKQKKPLLSRYTAVNKLIYYGNYNYELTIAYMNNHFKHRN